jgi:hypothetical protein
MSRKQSRVGTGKKRKSISPRRRLPRVGSIVAGGFVAAVVGFIALIVVYEATGGNGGASDFVPSIIETPSESGAEPVEGGARLYFPVDSIDMGRVPLNTEVGYAFAMTNLGDTAAHIEDVNVSMLEGC